MIEVEAKVSVINPNRIRKISQGLAKFIGKTKKIDDYYTLEDLKKFPKKSLRIRRMDGYYVVNFKHPIEYKKGVHAKKEVEFKVSDINNFLNLIEDFGFVKWVSKEKNCEVFEIAKNFHIELNNVRELGWFVEVEYLVSDKRDVSAAREEVFRVLGELGYSRKDAIKRGYTKQLWEKKYGK